MKKLVTAIGIASAAYLIANKWPKEPTKPPTIKYSVISFKGKIAVVYLQDGTQSLLENGVEMIIPTMFISYYTCTDKDIDLYYGMIVSHSTAKLVHLNLTHFNILKPQMPELANDKSALREQYTRAQERYIADSTEYSFHRLASIKKFNIEVAAMAQSQITALSGLTDIVTAVANADKVFNGIEDSTVGRFLILNSDGKDSYRATIPKMENKAYVILVNASGNESTSVDAIVNKKLESSEDAIKYTLTHFQNSAQ